MVTLTSKESWLQNPRRHKLWPRNASLLATLLTIRTSYPIDAQSWSSRSCVVIHSQEAIDPPQDRGACTCPSNKEGRIVCFLLLDRFQFSSSRESALVVHSETSSSAPRRFACADYTRISFPIIAVVSVDLGSFDDGWNRSLGSRGFIFCTNINACIDDCL
jgi:hypothetical protein